MGSRGETDLALHIIFRAFDFSTDFLSDIPFCALVGKPDLRGRNFFQLVSADKTIVPLPFAIPQNLFRLPNPAFRVVPNDAFTGSVRRVLAALRGVCFSVGTLTPIRVYRA